MSDEPLEQEEVATLDVVVQLAREGAGLVDAGAIEQRVGHAVESVQRNLYALYRKGRVEVVTKGYIAVGRPINAARRAIGERSPSSLNDNEWLVLRKVVEFWDAGRETGDIESTAAAVFVSEVRQETGLSDSEIQQALASIIDKGLLMFYSTGITSVAIVGDSS